MEGFLQLIVDADNIPIAVNDDVNRWAHDSFLHGYHAYMPIWMPLVGDDSLVCHKEGQNMHDQHAVAIVRENTVVGHVPQNI